MVFEIHIAVLKKVGENIRSFDRICNVHRILTGV